VIVSSSICTVAKNTRYPARIDISRPRSVSDIVLSVVPFESVVCYLVSHLAVSLLPTQIITKLQLDYILILHSFY